MDDAQFQATKGNSSSEADDPVTQGDRDVSASSSNVEDNEDPEVVNYFSDNSMQVDREFISSGGLMGIKYKARDKADEVMNPVLRKTNRDLKEQQIFKKKCGTENSCPCGKTKYRRKIIYSQYQKQHLP
jgi:hypothetical protein